MAFRRLSANVIFNLSRKSSISNENIMFVGLLRVNPLVGAYCFNGGKGHAIIETPVVLRCSYPILSFKPKG